MNSQYHPKTHISWITRDSLFFPSNSEEDLRPTLEEHEAELQKAENMRKQIKEPKKKSKLLALRLERSEEIH